MPIVEVTVLGGFSVRVAGVPVPDRAWRRRSASRLVGLLALSEGRALHREQVLAALWPDLAPDAALPRLHQAAHYARSALGLDDGVVLRHDLVMLLPGAEVRVDLVALRHRAERALREGTADAAGRVLVDLAGELLPEDLYAEWTTPHRECLAALRDQLLRLADRPDRRRRGLLLIVDDLAEADTASLRLLRHVAAALCARGVGRVLEIGGV